MKLATTTDDFGKYGILDNDIIDKYDETGFKYLDYSFCEQVDKNSYLLQDDWKDYLKSVAKKAAGKGIKFVQAHCPCGNPFEKGEKFDMYFTAVTRSIEACSMLGVKNAVLHAGLEEGLKKDDYFNKNAIFYKKLFPIMEKFEVNVLIENSAEANVGSCYYFMEGSEMSEFLDSVNHPLLHACWDIGHGNLRTKPQYENIIELGNHLKALHIQDNFGQLDEHIAPFMGSVNMDEIMHALLKIDYKGYFTFEANNILRFGDAFPHFKNKNNYGSNLLYNPGIELQKQAVALLYQIGKHILNTYNCYEE